ncbi:MAG: nonstructural protein [Microvirus sp.]|nr:MAG: nonstructural protein [Microvirus sp.]
MLRTLVCLFDSKAQMFLSPFVVPHLAVAFREIKTAAARKGEGNGLADYPGDFQLYELGTFDDSSGDVEGLLRLVCDVRSIVEGE